MKLFKRGKKTGDKSGLPADLRDNNQKFRVIINSIDDGVVMIDDQADHPADKPQRRHHVRLVG